MPVIALVNQKGGCGKSTASIHLSYWLTHLGKRVLLIDADAQQSSSQWADAIGLPNKILRTPDELIEQVPLLAAQHDYLVLDAAGALSEVTRAILLRCDLAVIPCQPSGVDLRSATDAVRLIQQAQSVRGGIPRAAAFLNRATPRTKLKEEAMALIQSLPSITALKTVIHQRQPVADAYGQGATVFQLPGATEAAREYEALCKEILEVLT